MYAVMCGLERMTAMTVKKILACFLAAALVIGFASCKSRSQVPKETVSDIENRLDLEREQPRDPEEPLSEPEKEPEAEPENGVVEELAGEMLDALKTGDKNSIQPYIDYDSFFNLEDAAAADWQYRQILAHMRYEILSSEILGEEASVLALIGNVRMETVLPLFYRQAMELEFNNASSENPLSGVDLESKFMNLFDDLLSQNEADIIEKDVKIKFKKVGDEWKIYPDLKLQNAILGDFSAARAKVGENVG